MKEAKKSTGRARQTDANAKAFSPQERAAMRDRVREMRAASKPAAKAGTAEAEAEVRAKIAAMSAPDRSMGERLHALIRSAAPDLKSRLWYGMPAYSKGDQVVLFFQPAEKFGTRYATLGFSDEANLDDGAMWPSAYAITELTAAEEERIRVLVRRAVA